MSNAVAEHHESDNVTHLAPAGSKQQTLTQRFAERFHVEPAKLFETLKCTAFRQQDGSAPTNEQMMALMVVADQYKLNPFTREIYAFPDKGGIVPVVGVDGWARIINQHPQFDGMDFEQDAESCTCTIHRKDRKHPIRVTEWMSECSRGTKPWQSHPRRMLRHKAMIQCARVAFSFAGIYDPDEAERITEESATTEPPAQDVRPELEPYPDDRFAANLDKWRQVIQSGRMTPDEIIATASTRGVLSDEQKKKIRACEVTDAEFTDTEGETE